VRTDGRGSVSKLFAAALRARLQVVSQRPRAVVPKLCSAGPKGSATSSQGIRGYISVVSTLTFTYVLIKAIIILKI
jgi:hypothetical protein